MLRAVRNGRHTLSDKKVGCHIGSLALPKPPAKKRNSLIGRVHSGIRRNGYEEIAFFARLDDSETHPIADSGSGNRRPGSLGLLGRQHK